MLCSNSQFIIITKVVGGGSSYRMLMGKYWGADKSLAQPGKKQATATGFLVSYTVFIIIIGGMLVLYIYIKTRLALNEIFSPSNKIHREVGRVKDLSAPLLILTRKETCYNNRRFWCPYVLFIITIGGILLLFIYITRLASNEIFSPSNKIHREVGRAKDLSASL